MAKAVDVAEYILEKLGSATTMKLQKLVFYSQAKYAVSSGSRLFDERIEAWANGPVVPELYRAHVGAYMLRSGAFSRTSDVSSLSDAQRAAINSVIDSLGTYSGEQLRELTHAEEPWANVRRGVPEGERSSNQISFEAIASYYGSNQCTNPAMFI